MDKWTLDFIAVIHESKKKTLFKNTFVEIRMVTFFEDGVKMKK